MKRVPCITFFDLSYFRSIYLQKRNLTKKYRPLAKLIWVLLIFLNATSIYASDVGLLFPDNNQTRLPISSFSLVWVDVPVPADQTIVYDVYFGTSTNPALFKADITDGWTDGTGVAYTMPYDTETTAFIYAEGPGLLEYNTTYYWKIVAKISDGTTYNSELYTFTTIRENTLPSSPQPVYPGVNATDISSENLTLQWTASIDQENDPVTYRLYFGKNNNNPPLIEDNLTTNSYQIPYQLEDQAIYFWKVEAVDGYDESVVAGPVRRFTVENYFNDPPTAPVALSPDNDTNIGKEVIFKWTASTDKDNDEIRYNIYADDNPDPSTLVAENIGYDQWYTIYIEEAYNRKYWKVEATDGVNYVESQVLSYIPYERPEAPTLLVADNIVNVGRRPTLVWTASSPNPDEIIYYDLYLDKNPSPTTLVAPGIRETSFTPLVKEPYSTYYWKIVTRDASGVLFESPVRSFIPWKNNNNSINIEMVDVKGSEFLMGSPEYTMIVPGFETWGKLFVENMTPQRSVFVDDFSMAKYEITYAQYLAFLNAIKDSWFVDEENNNLVHIPGTMKMASGGPVASDPVLLCKVKSDAAPFDFKIHSKLTWDGSGLFIKSGFENYPANWLTVKGMELFLDWADKRAPSEAEWEYAARGGNQSQNYMYGGSDNAVQAAWFLFGDVNMDNPMTGKNNGVTERNNKGTNVVGLKAANELGIYDISGNVRELCSDYYFANQYLHMEYYNPLGPVSGTSRSARGGSYTGLRAEIMTWARSLATIGITGIRAAGNHSGSTTTLLHGIVRNEYGKPMKNINLNVAKSNSITTKSGRYQFRVNKGEPVIIRPSHSDYTFSPSELQLDSPEAVETGLNFTAYLKRKVKISGTVTDQHGNGLEGISIDGFPDQVITLGNGQFSIYVPEESAFTLSIKTRGYKPSEGRIVTVVQNDMADVDFTLEYVGYYTLSGTITNKFTGDPLTGVMITGLDTEVQTLGNGTFFTSVTVGWSGEIKPVGMNFSRVFSPKSVKIDNFTENMEVHFQDLRATEYFYGGKVVDIHGDPVEGVKIAGFDNSRAITNRNGEFGLQMGDGWTGTITPQLDGYTFSPPSHEAYVAASWDTPPPSKPYFVAIPPGAYSISGTVTDANGYPLQGVILTGLEGDVRTDLNGRYSVWVDSETSYSIQPVFAGYTFAPEIFETNSIQSNITQDFVAVEDMKSVYTVTFSISNGSDIIENATVGFNGSDYASGANGQVVINKVEAGTYNYHVSAPGYHEKNGSVIITNQDIKEDITLNRIETPVYTVTFHISNGSESIENAVVDFNGSTFIPDVNGQVEIVNVTAGTYVYHISASGYHEINGSVVIVDQDINETIILVPEEIPVYAVTFNVRNSTDNIQNAVLDFNGSTYVSDVNGQVVITNVAPGTYAYTVYLNEDEITDGSITVTNANVTENVVITITSLRDDIHVRGIKCYPNPSNGKLNISINGYSFKEGYITIVNPLSQSQTFQLVPGVNKYVWHIENAYGIDYKEGVYLLSIFLDSKLVDVKKLLFEQK